MGSALDRRPVAWNSKYTRRQVLRAAGRVGVGALSLALVGCSSDEPDAPPRPERDSADRSTPQATSRPQPEQADAPSTRADLTAARIMAQEDAAFAPAAETVETLTRERLHGRNLSYAPGRADGPMHGGSLRMHAFEPAYWSPLEDNQRHYFDSVLRWTSTSSLLPLVYSQLVTLGGDDEIDPHHDRIEGDLAASWEWPEPTALVFQLHPEAIWPDALPLSGGLPVTAWDVATSLQTYRSQTEPNRAQRLASTYEAVDSIEPLNDLTLRLNLSQASVPLLRRMTGPQHVVLPPEVLDKADDVDIDTVGIGSGPFQITSSQDDYGRSGQMTAIRMDREQILGGWTATANPHYWKRDAAGRRLPYLATVYGRPADTWFPVEMKRQELADWRFGRVDLVSPELDSLNAAAAAHGDAVAQVTAPRPGGGPLSRFTRLPQSPFADPRLRLAFSLALDRRAFVDRHHGGQAALDCGMNWTFTYDQQGQRREWPWSDREVGQTYRPDADEAAALLHSAGYDAANPLSISIDQFRNDGEEGVTVFSNILQPAVLNSCQQQWKQLFGDALQIQRVVRSVNIFDFAAGFTDYLSHGADAVDLHFAPYASEREVEPDELTYVQLHSEGAGNYSGISDPLLDELCELQRTEVDPIARSELLEDIRWREQEQVWRLHLINPYGAMARRGYVYNYADTYFGHTLEMHPKRLERTWVSQG